MNELLFSQKLYPNIINHMEIYMSPLFTINRFEIIVKKYGVDKILNESKFKKAREMWVGATFLLGMSKILNKKYWLRPEYINEPPDIYATTISPYPEKGGNQKTDFFIEIMDWDWHSGDTLLDAIAKKLKDVRYPKEYVLLIYGKQMPDTPINMEEIFIKLNQEKININSIWILLPTKNIPDCDHHICCLYPEKLKCDFSFQEEKNEINNISQEEIISFLRRKGTDNVRWGKIQLDLPNL